jgi:hypothetical protein
MYDDNFMQSLPKIGPDMSFATLEPSEFLVNRAAVSSDFEVTNVSANYRETLGQCSSDGRHRPRLLLTQVTLDGRVPNIRHVRVSLIVGVHAIGC